jgi:hypothetical protein
MNYTRSHIIGSQNNTKIYAYGELSIQSIQSENGLSF